MKPFEFEGLTIQRGINYTVTGFGENIVGNGSSTSITVICMCNLHVINCIDTLCIMF